MYIERRHLLRTCDSRVSKPWPAGRESLGKNQPNLPYRWEGAGTHLIYQVDKGLGVLSRETFDNLNLIIVREDGRYQGDALVHGKGIVDQQLPGWRVAVYEKIIKSMNV